MKCECGTKTSLTVTSLSPSPLRDCVAMANAEALSSEASRMFNP